MQNSVILQNVTYEQFVKLMSDVFREQLKEFKKELNTKADNDDLLTREQTATLLQINLSTLYHWTNKGRVKPYRLLNKVYYKRSEIMASLSQK
jgi:predicted DNA-binding transcriptional regulator AlpA